MRSRAVILAMTILFVSLNPVPIFGMLRTDRIVRPAVVRPQVVIASRGDQVSTAREMLLVASAYTYSGHRTFTGTWPGRGTVAVDPKVIPLGTRLWVEGYGPGIAVDTGGAIRGKRVDLYMASRGECISWGRRVVRVRIEGEAK
jgi:3D (Asp-Asp-Asp) domain-containing protein